MAEDKNADRGIWDLGLPKGCPCTPAVLCQATPRLFARHHGCSNPDFPVQQDYSLSGSSGEHCDAMQGYALHQRQCKVKHASLTGVAKFINACLKKVTPPLSGGSASDQPGVAGRDVI